MIIYLSMILVLFLVYCVQNVKKRGEYKSETSRVEMMLVFGYIIFWTGIRDGFVDTYAYISKFNNANLEDLQYLEFTIDSGFGFDILEIVFKTFISDNYHMWLMFLAIITGGCIAVTFRRYSVNFYYTVFLFLASTNFTWLMNGIRQFLAVAIIFACTPLIEKKRWCAYCMIV